MTARAALLLALGSAAGRPALEKPNIVFMFVDDLGYGDVGFTGHPTTHTPTIDKLAASGKVLTSWYSACPVCSASRASALTGRQWPRFAMPGVYSPDTNYGLPLNETTIANQLKTAGYATGIVGKWHVGQRQAYLPAARGFDAYLGIPYSVDMGNARKTPCPGADGGTSAHGGDEAVEAKGRLEELLAPYVEAGLAERRDLDASVGTDPARDFLPLVSQRRPASGPVETKVLEQPLDLTTLSDKYSAFVSDFVDQHAARPFFLYMPFSHVHTTSAIQPQMQYCGCDAKNATRRGPFGDALAEVDDLVTTLVRSLDRNKLQNNSLLLFTGDNGPWLARGLSGGSVGLLAGRYAGYWNVGKGSTWEGGIREAAFAYWPGVISPATRTAEVISTMDVLPTALALAGVPLPTDRVYDGRDASALLMKDGATSLHNVLFFYGGHAYGGSGSPAPGQTVATPSAARYGPFKAHWITGPGLGRPGGCPPSPAAPIGCPTLYYTGGPLIFNIDEDPAEMYPISVNSTTSPRKEITKLIAVFQEAREKEMASNIIKQPPPAPDGPGEGPGTYGVCCDRKRGCDCDGPPSA